MITSTANERVKAIRRLHTAKGRREAGKTLVEGPNGLEALRASTIRPSEIFMLESDIDSAAYAETVGVSPTVVAPDVLKAASDTQHPVGPLCVIDVPPPVAVRSHQAVCMVDVADPGNVGTIVRTAVALGWDVVVCGATSDPWSPKALRASAGATLRAHLAVSADPVSDAASTGVTTVALVVADGDRPDPTEGPVMLLVGSEAHGLPANMAEQATRRVTIPMTGGIESLNAAVSAAVTMYALG